MTIGKRIIGGYLFALAFLAIVMATGYYSLTAVRQTYDEFLDKDTQLILGAVELKLEARDEAAQVRGLLLYPQERERLTSELRTSQKDFLANKQHEFVLIKVKKTKRNPHGFVELEIPISH